MKTFNQSNVTIMVDVSDKFDNNWSTKAFRSMASVSFIESTKFELSLRFIENSSFDLFALEMLYKCSQNIFLVYPCLSQTQFDMKWREENSVSVN